jgi:hypothetical protein
MRTLHWTRLGVGVLLAMSLLGCSAGRTSEQPAATPAPGPSTAAAPAPTPPPETAPAPPTAECAGICYHDLPNGTCESMPTCCPRTVHLKVPPHCPADYTLELKSGPERCAVRRLCVD